MKSRKMFSIFILSICLLAGCTSESTTDIYDNDKQIASYSNTFSLINCEQDLEDKYFVASVEKMDGMDTIWNYNASEDTILDITYTLNVFSGKVKLVLINDKRDITVLAECDSEMTEPVQNTLNVESGHNRIKIVADENAKFDIELSISEGEFEELGKVFENE